MSSLLDEHLGYVADSTRLALFRAAIAQTIKPGDCVADLGCGSGILGLLCLQAGAARVYAIDSGPIIDVARQSLRRAGFADRAVFIQDLSSRISLPEPVDVVICDHVGYFGIDYGILGFFQDARQRLLKPGGVLLPSLIRLQIAPVESPGDYDKRCNGWQAEDIPDAFHWLRGHAVNSKHAINLQAANVLGAAAELAAIDLHQPQPDFFSWRVELEIARDGWLHGLAGWFACQLAPGVAMSNSPLAENPIGRPQAFLPIERAVEVKAGEKLVVTLMMRPAEHLIAWNIEFPASGQRFSHSTWHGELLNREQLIRLNPARALTLSYTGRATALVLGYCDGRRTAREIEQAILRDHPGLFPSEEETRRFVAQTLGGNCG